MLDFRTDAKSVLMAVCKKLVQKTPAIKYPVARSLSCLASAPEHSRTMMKRFLPTCVEANLVPETVCDVIMTGDRIADNKCGQR